MVKKIGSFVLLSVLLGCSSEPKLEVHQGYALGTSYSIQYQELEEERKKRMQLEEEVKESKQAVSWCSENSAGLGRLFS